MTPTLLTGLIVFALVAAITPGPNNIMLMTSGATYGLRPTLPHLAGVVLGFGVMVLTLGWGLAGVFAVVPVLYKIIRVVGTAYLLYLAYKTATARGLTDGTAATRPITFTQAAAFQWVNPKAWTSIVAAVTTYAPTDHLFRNVAIVAVVCASVTVFGATTWAVFGLGLRQLLKRPRTLRAFNICMALLLVASIAPTVREMV